ncbi:MAG: nuclear transport factor 2 family protein [Deltaproteobacteria bacterium]|nr:MAG: nuclear transport factor 2 family protein [Deltaproteobacteria bacterium]
MPPTPDHELNTFARKGRTTMLDSTNRRRCAAAFVAVLLTASFAARASAVADDVADEVRTVEQRRVAALTSRDYATLEKLLGDDLTYTHSNGRFENKAQFLNSLRSGDLEYRLMQHADVQVRPHPLEVPIRFTLVYVKRAGDWQLVAWQSAPLQNP